MNQSFTFSEFSSQVCQGIPLHKTVRKLSTLLFAALLAIGFASVFVSSATAQDEPLLLNQQLGDLGFDVPADNPDEPVTLSASFKMKQDSRVGTLSIKADIAENWHLYSVTQPKGGPIRSKIEVNDSDEFKLTGEFTPDNPPHVSKNPSFDVNVEDHELQVIWSAPIELAENVSPEDIEIEVIFNGQTCVSNENGEIGTCLLVERDDLVAEFQGYEATAGSFMLDMTHAIFKGVVENAESGKTTIEPGDKILLQLTAEPIDGYHIYKFEHLKPEEAAINPTLIAVTKRNGWAISGPSSKSIPTTKIINGNPTSYYDDPVTWTYELIVPRGTETKTHSIGGLIGFQTCTDSVCDMPAAVDFNVEIPVGTAASGPIMLAFSASEEDYMGVAKAAAVVQKSSAKTASASDGGAWADKSIWFVLPLAFLAGLILNVMPCVLPVIGLKIMSFVEQAGENPGRVFLLNLTFALGMIAVFLILATLAVFFGYGWGDLYQSLLFKTIMIAVVFAFGLSFFGVWEIPIPGFVGSGAGSEVAEKEGLVGAFAKGILTTLLATPCSGPMLVPAVVWAIAQPPATTYLVFLAMGVGMAFPYILIGAIPSLAKFLPRPGAWMETFKQLMGFVLMGTAVFFIGGAGSKYMIPILAFLCFLALACWWIGRTSLAAEFGTKVKTWLQAGVIIAIGFAFAFLFLIPPYELEWKQFSKASIDAHLKEGNIVFVDFTADW